MRPTTYLRTFIFVTAIIFTINESKAQTDSYDIYKFTPQPGWIREESDGYISYSRTVNKTICVIKFYSSAQTKGNPMLDFQTDWDDLIVRYNNITTEVETESQIINGWNMTLGTASGHQKLAKKIGLHFSLISFSGPMSRGTITMMHNDDNGILEAEIAAFMAGLSVWDVSEIAVNGVKSGMSPGVDQTPVQQYQPPTQQYQPPTMTTGNNGGTFPTPVELPVLESTMMQEGWFVEATADYMQYTRNDIKVIQYFITENPTKDQFWNEYLNRFFATDHYTAYEDNRITSFATIEFASCMATYRPSGQQFFIAWLVDWVNDAAYLAITTSEPTYLQYFPEPKKLGEMLQFNNFPVSQQAIQGEWTNDDGTAAQMYNVNTGNYAGMAIAQASRKYTFSGNEYHFFAQGSTGTVGNNQVFQSEEKGTFQVSNYDMTVEIKTPKPERVDYLVAFRYAKNIKTLWMQNKNASGLTFTLVRKQ